MIKNKTADQCAGKCGGRRTMDRRYKGIVFDLDGTLLDTERMNLVPLQRLIQEELGRKVDYEALRPYMAHTGRDSLRLLGFADIEGAYAKWVGHIERSGEKARLYEGWREVIARFVEEGLSCGIASSKSRHQYALDFSPTGLKKYMRAVVLLEDTKQHKPHPAPLFLAGELLGIEPEGLLYVGDTAFDARAAASAGMGFALAAWSGTKSLAGADYVLHKPTDLLRILDR